MRGPSSAAPYADAIAMVEVQVRGLVASVW
jgi:hypothetical protein